MVLEQKYLEHLEAGRVLDALHVLRNELTPLQYDTPRVHRLSALMMCADARELQARAHWPGSGPHSRATVLARVQVHGNQTCIIVSHVDGQSLLDWSL